MNVIGAFTCFRLEHAARTSFLEREIVSILGGNDGATGIPNRRMFNRHLQSVRRQAERDGKSVALLVIEIDEFEEYRHRYGSPAAEKSLRRVAHTITRSLNRPLDLAARFADGQYAVLFYDPDPAHLQSLIREIRERVLMLDIPHEESGLLELLTVSVGAAVSPAGADHDPEQLLVVANRALGLAKDTEKQGFAVLCAPFKSTGGQVVQGPWTTAIKD